MPLSRRISSRYHRHMSTALFNPCTSPARVRVTHRIGIGLLVWSIPFHCNKTVSVCRLVNPLHGHLTIFGTDLCVNFLTGLLHRTVLFFEGDSPSRFSISFLLISFDKRLDLVQQNDRRKLVVLIWTWAWVDPSLIRSVINVFFFKLSMKYMTSN